MTTYVYEINSKLAFEQALKVKWEPAASMTNEFEYLPRNVRFSNMECLSLYGVVYNYSTVQYNSNFRFLNESQRIAILN
jgi:hypothetical protein